MAHMDQVLIGEGVLPSLRDAAAARSFSPGGP